MPHPFSFSLKSFRGRVLHCAQKKSPPPNRSPPFIRCQHFASDDREGGRKSVKLFFFSISGGERRCIKGTFCGGADVIERESLGVLLLRTVVATTTFHGRLKVEVLTL